MCVCGEGVEGGDKTKKTKKKNNKNCKFDVILTVHRRYYVEIEYQLDATEVFIADLIACSTCFGHHYAHHQELKSIIQWLLPVVFRTVKM